MAHIFISYNEKNHEYARKLANRLLAEGFDVWIDDRIDYGEDWWSIIVKAIRSCAAFIVLMTPDSDQSRWVQREVTIADELRKPTFPLLLSGNLVSSEHWMIYVRTQYVDVSSGQLPGDEFFQRLASVARRRNNHGKEVATPPYGRVLRTPDKASVKQVAAPAAPPPTPAPVKAAPKRTASLLDVSEILPQPFAWCKIPDGEVELEDATIDGGSPGGRFTVDRYYMAKYPITNAQYQVFVEAEDGYSNPEWWAFSDDAAFWRRAHRNPETPEFPEDEMPRTQVPWYDAVAFCRWLTARLTQRFAQGNMPIAIQVTLPTEAQWQRAAQGDDGREYPWGEEFDKDYCNTPPGRQRKPTGVTRYERGASPYGVMDMSGNAWEWCINEWLTDDLGLDGERKRVVRGGSWDDLPHFARTTHRNWFHCTDSHNCQGFRVVLVAAAK